MKIGLATAGSRGDVQPFLALALALREAGHEVVLATCAPFAAQVRAAGVAFELIGGDIKEIVGDQGRAALQAAGGNPLRAVAALRRYVGPLVDEGLARLPDALAGADLVLGQLLAPGAASVAEAMGVPYADVAYAPIRPTRAFAHPGAPPSTPAGLPGLLSWYAAEQVFWQAFRPAVNQLRRRLGLHPAPWWGPTVRASRRPAALLGYSRALVPVPADWPSSVTVTGPWLLDPPPGWTPPPRLLDFLSAGPPPVYVGFGSMTAPDPEALTAVVLAALRRQRLRALIAPGWGGLSPVASDDVLSVGDLPHAWLFPRVAAVVHHGGASTTAEALRAGVPQLVVPFLADQPFWGARVAAAGLGPAPLPVDGLREGPLAEALAGLSRPEIQDRAREIGAQVRQEGGAARAVAAVARLAGSALDTPARRP